MAKWLHNFSCKIESEDEEANEKRGNYAKHSLDITGSHCKCIAKLYCNTKQWCGLRRHGLTWQSSINTNHLLLKFHNQFNQELNRPPPGTQYVMLVRHFWLTEVIKFTPWETIRSGNTKCSRRNIPIHGDNSFQAIHKIYISLKYSIGGIKQ